MQAPQAWIFNQEPNYSALQTVDAFFKDLVLLYDDPGCAAAAVTALCNLQQAANSAEIFQIFWGN